MDDRRPTLPCDVNIISTLAHCATPSLGCATSASFSSGVFHGRAEFSDELEQVHAKLPPGAVLARSTPIEEHHGRLRFGWCFRDGATGETFDGSPFAGFLRGMDVARVGTDGLLTDVTVFYDAGIAEQATDVQPRTGSG